MFTKINFVCVIFKKKEKHLTTSILVVPSFQHVNFNYFLPGKELQLATCKSDK